MPGIALAVVLAVACGACGAKPGNGARTTPAASADAKRPAVPALTSGDEPVPAFGASPRPPASPEPTAAGWKPILYEAGVASPPRSTRGRVGSSETWARARSEPAPKWERSARWWSHGAVVRWHELARALIVEHRTNVGQASRLLAALSVAQYDAAVAAHRTSGDEVGAIAAASIEALSHFYPGERRFLEQNGLANLGSRIWSGGRDPAMIAGGEAQGLGAATATIERLTRDGAYAAHAGPLVARQPDRWWSEQQLLPGWGNVRPWVLRSSDQFRAPPPPALDSPEFAAALAEIRAYSDALSAEQLAIAQFWNLGDGALTVPGFWDEYASRAIAEAGFSEPRAARAMALLHMALMDAGIASWETKFHYLVPRPSMRDPEIREPIGLPAMPAYTSGHSTFSGAAERVLAHLFPERAEELHRLAEEASASRFYGGVHYRFDGDPGLEQGRAVGDWVISQRAANDGCPPLD